MKTLISFTIIAVLFAQAAVGLADNNSGEKTQQIQWLTNVDQALAVAKSKNKPVFLEVFNPR
jgi:hypothetical protein